MAEKDHVGGWRRGIVRYAVHPTDMSRVWQYAQRASLNDGAFRCSALKDYISSVYHNSQLVQTYQSLRPQHLLYYSSTKIISQESRPRIEPRTWQVRTAMHLQPLHTCTSSAESFSRIPIHPNHTSELNLLFFTCISNPQFSTLSLPRAYTPAYTTVLAAQSRSSYRAIAHLPHRAPTSAGPRTRRGRWPTRALVAETRLGAKKTATAMLLRTAVIGDSSRKGR